MLQGVGAEPVEEALLVGGHVAAFIFGAVQLFDADTGALVALFHISCIPKDIHPHAVCDRWLVCSGSIGEDERAVLLDCVTAQLVDLAPSQSEYAHFSVAGPCMSFYVDGSTVIPITHVSGGPNNSTILREVTRVTLSCEENMFTLCERGLAYVLLDVNEKTLQLFDMATHLCRRVFTPRALPCASATFCCSDWCAAAGFALTGTKFSGDTGFFLAIQQTRHPHTYAAQFQVAVVRISGEAAISETLVIS